jgi:uncharacterized protein with GYD domain
MDLVDLKVLAKMAATLPPLALEHRGRVLLDLMNLGVDSPIGRIGVAPLRANSDGRGRDRALFQPATEKVLAEAVGRGRIKVTDAGRSRRIEHAAGVRSGEATMATFIMLTRLAHGAIRSPEELEKLEKEVMKRIEEGLGGGQVKWLANYAVLGPYDYLDIFEVPDIEAAMKVSAIVRTRGHAHTEVWAATEWKRFKEIVRGLPSGGD